jgi:hypothetical protein
MSRFPTPEALVSWAGLTPTARQSGPRKSRGKKGHGNTYAKRIAVLAAYAAANTDIFLGERFRRLASRPGGGGRKKAGCAVGPVHPRHRLAPAQRPRRPLPRPGIRLARPAHQPQPQGPQRPAPARDPRLRRHHHPPGGRRLIPEPARTEQPSPQVPGSPQVGIDAVTPRTRGHLSGLRWSFLGQFLAHLPDLAFQVFQVRCQVLLARLPRRPGRPPRPGQPGDNPGRAGSAYCDRQRLAWPSTP